MTRQNAIESQFVQVILRPDQPHFIVITMTSITPSQWELTLSCDSFKLGFLHHGTLRGTMRHSILCQI